MVFEQIEKLKVEYTDKYVVVDADRPELRRFKSMTGVVRTINMNGRALVEFDAFQNIGWYDIDLDFLRVVDKPVEAEKPTKAAKPAAKKASPAKAAAAKPAAKGGGMSVEEIMAAARGGAAPAAEKKTAPAKAKDAKPAAAMSVADILAAARGESAPAADAPQPEPAAEEVAKEVQEEPTPEASESEPKSAAPVGSLPTDVEGIVEFCRKTDG